MQNLYFFFLPENNFNVPLVRSCLHSALNSARTLCEEQSNFVNKNRLPFLDNSIVQLPNNCTKLTAI